TAHNADINNEVHVTGLLNCPGHGPTCGLCNVVNVDASTGNCRCGSIGGQNLPGQGTQDICNTPFQTASPECPMCENAQTKNRSACVTNTDCIDDTPRCSKTSKVCANNNTKTCTTNTDCGGGTNTCPAKL